MCVSPLTIRNRSIYQNKWDSPYTYTVPCCKCDSCRELQRTEWETRLSYEINDCYAHNGKVVFLTPTYDNKHLPVFRYSDEFGIYSFPCFSSEDVLSFKEKFRAAVTRRWGPNSWRYFWASEYGKDTRRPHYHVTCFLSYNVDMKEFVELFREYWTKGFLFPKFDKRLNTWVDKYGKPCTPELRDKAGSAKYVSKYACKDLSFYTIPNLEYYIEKFGTFRLRPFLPRHWQSNKIGYGIFNTIDFKDESQVLRVLHDGVMNPVSGKVTPLPSYCINRLLYKNVRTDLVGKPRYGSDGKLLYDRELTDFGRYYFRHVFDNRVEKFCKKYQKVFSYIEYEHKDVMLSEISPILNKLKIRLDDCNSFRSCALWHIMWKSFLDKPLLLNILDGDGDIDSLFDPDLAFNAYLRSKDLSYLRSVDRSLVPDFFGNVPINTYFKRYLYSDYDLLELFFVKYSIEIENYNNDSYRKRGEEIELYRRMYKCLYDVKLC